MIPRTFPSIIEAFQTKMVVYVLPSITGLTAWIDYIPVKGVVTESDTLANTYANGGYQVVKSLESLTGLQAWIGYIPVYEDASYNKPWSTDAGGYIPVGGLFSIPSLFASGAKGVWYDPSGLTTLFQDSAGTTPVTAVEQPVGLMLDKSGTTVQYDPATMAIGSYDGNGATTITRVGASLTFTSAASGDGIRFNAITINDNFAVIEFTASGSGSLFVFAGSSPIIATLTSTPTRFRAATQPNASAFTIFRSNSAGTSANITIHSVTGYRGNHAFQATSASRPVLSARVNKLLATATLATQSVTTRAAAHTLRFEGAGSITLSGTATGTFAAGSHSVTATAGTLTLTVSGSVTSADLRETNDGVGVPTYQAVVTSTNYDTTGFLPYLKFDGVDDSLSTNSISFTSTDKMSVFAGVRKLSDAADGILTELSATVSTNNGSFAVLAPYSSTTNTLGFALRGSAARTNQITGSSPYAAPTTLVLSVRYDTAETTSAAEILPRVNGVVPSTSTNGAADSGTGNFGNYPLYIGRRGGSSVPFNGQLYSMVIVGKAVTAGELTNTEKFVATKTGVTL